MVEHHALHACVRVLLQSVGSLIGGAHHAVGPQLLELVLEARDAHRAGASLLDQAHRVGLGLADVAPGHHRCGERVLRTAVGVEPPAHAPVPLACLLG